MVTPGPLTSLFMCIFLESVLTLSLERIEVHKWSPSSWFQLFVDSGLLMERALKYTARFIPLPWVCLFVGLEAKQQRQACSEFEICKRKINYPQAEADL